MRLIVETYGSSFMQDTLYTSAVTLTSIGNFVSWVYENII